MDGHQTAHQVAKQAGEVQSAARTEGRDVLEDQIPVDRPQGGELICCCAEPWGSLEAQVLSDHDCQQRRERTCDKAS